jgi:hypothetical protein
MSYGVNSHFPASVQAPENHRIVESSTQVDGGNSHDSRVQWICGGSMKTSGAPASNPGTATASNSSDGRAASRDPRPPSEASPSDVAASDPELDGSPQPSTIAPQPQKSTTIDKGKGAKHRVMTDEMGSLLMGSSMGTWDEVLGSVTLSSTRSRLRTDAGTHAS